MDVIDNPITSMKDSVPTQMLKAVLQDTVNKLVRSGYEDTLKGILKQNDLLNHDYNNSTNSSNDTNSSSDEDKKKKSDGGTYVDEHDNNSNNNDIGNIALTNSNKNTSESDDLSASFDGPGYIEIDKFDPNEDIVLPNLSKFQSEPDKATEKQLRINSIYEDINEMEKKEMSMRQINQELVGKIVDTKEDLKINQIEKELRIAEKNTKISLLVEENKRIRNMYDNVVLEFEKEKKKKMVETKHLIAKYDSKVHELEKELSYVKKFKSERLKVLQSLEDSKAANLDLKEKAERDVRIKILIYFKSTLVLHTFFFFDNFMKNKSLNFY